MSRATVVETGYPYLDQPPGGADVLAFAHRGGAEHPDLVGLENTGLAFAHAVGLGYRYLETDVQVSADGELFALHDDLLHRTTGADGSIGDLTAAQVEALRVGGREPIPRLVDLVRAHPSARFNIDIKGEGADVALARFIAEHDLADRVLVGSFSARRLGRFRRLSGRRVPTAASRWEIVAFMLLPARLADAVTRGRVAALQVPLRRGVPVATRRLVRRAHQVNKHVHVWTLDARDEIEHALDLGVDGVMTDRTDVLRGVLQERGLWAEEKGTVDDD